MRPLSAHTMSSAPKWHDNPNKYPAKVIGGQKFRTFKSEFFVPFLEERGKLMRIYLFQIKRVSLPIALFILDHLQSWPPFPGGSQKNYEINVRNF